jgi:hypothetical protein
MRSQQFIDKSIVFNAGKLGQSSLATTGGTITSGVIHGTLYNNEVIGGSNNFENFGPVSFTIGGGSGSGNSLFFGNLTKPVPIFVHSIDGKPISGAVSAILSKYATLTQAGFGLHHFVVPRQADKSCLLKM